MAKKENRPLKLSREELAQMFHKVYLNNIKKETAARGKLVGVSGERLKEIFNESVGEFGELLLGYPTSFPR